MKSREWVTEGFEAFRAGTFGTAGHNLDVSRAGVLERIHHYDLDQDGYVDVVFTNSRDCWETAPALLYRRASSNAEWLAADDAVDAPAGGGYLQYRLGLGATNSGSTPRIHRVAVAIESFRG